MVQVTQKPVPEPEPETNPPAQSSRLSQRYPVCLVEHWSDMHQTTVPKCWSSQHLEKIPKRHKCRTTNREEEAGISFFYDHLVLPLACSPWGVLRGPEGQGGSRGKKERVRTQRGVWETRLWDQLANPSSPTY